MSQKKYKKFLFGFTLLELLMVISILSIVSSVIIINIGNRHSFKEMNTYSRLLKSQIQVAREQSILEMTVLGLIFDGSQYEFYQYSERPQPGWIPLRKTDNFWNIYSVPNGIQLDLVIQGNLNLNNYMSQSQRSIIIFFPSGEITPFILTIQSKNVSRKLQLIGSFGGDISLEELS